MRPAGQLRPGTAGVPVQPESFAYFGSALSFDGADVYVGAPGTDGPDDQVAVGAVGRMRLAFDANGQVIISGGVLLTEDTVTGGSRPEAGDEFGAALAALPRGGVAIGAPGDGAGGAVFAGRPGEDFLRLTQDTPGMPGATEPGDWFGSSLAACGDRVLVGSPGETVGTVVEAGMVIELGTDRGWTQNSQGVPGTARAGAHFGSAVARTFEGDSERILVGAPHTTNSRGEVVTGLLTDGPALADGTLWTLATATPNDHQEYGLAVGPP